MTRSRLTPLLAGFVLIVLAWFIGSSLLERVYAAPRRDLLEQRDRYAKDIQSAEQQALDRITLDRELQSIVNRTLGSNSEAANSELRARLNRIGAELGLGQLRTNARTSSMVGSPAESAKFRNLASLRRRADFQELEGTINGRGTFEQALRLVHRIDAEPWLKHIDAVLLDPHDNGEQFDITVRLTTLFIPGATPEPATFTYDPSGFEAYRSLVELNPFHKPTPPPPPEQETKPAEQATPPPPSFPYGQWELRTVARAGQGMVSLGNRQTQETRWLTVGESIHDIVLVSVGLDGAVFKVGDESFTVSLGNTLNDREPVRH